MQVYPNFAPGDRVQLLHTEQTGEIVSIRQGKATVCFEYVILTVSLTEVKLIKSNKRPYERPVRKNHLSWSINQFIDFNPALDLHGLPPHEAIQALDKWIDQGVLSGHRHLRIIHGKGKGILRQHVHQYLRSNRIVSKIIDNHPFSGGSGITYIEL
jgi:DNA mismatch repair protein MutS2